MRNFKLKIVALLFAIGFWFFVLSQQKFFLTMEVPLVVSRVPEVLAIVSTPPKMISFNTFPQMYQNMMKIFYKIKNSFALTRSLCRLRLYPLQHPNN